jgi:excisionase family DNA binding protein
MADRAAASCARDQPVADNDVRLHLSAKEIAAAFSDPHWATRFPPILSVDQAAELLQVPKQTVYDWRSRGLLSGCCRKVGKHLRFFRDRLLLKLFNEETLRP